MYNVGPDSSKTVVLYYSQYCGIMAWCPNIMKIASTSTGVINDKAAMCSLLLSSPRYTTAVWKKQAMRSLRQEFLSPTVTIMQSTKVFESLWGLVILVDFIGTLNDGMVVARIIERKLRSTQAQLFKLFTVPCCSIIPLSSEGWKKTSTLNLFRTCFIVLQFLFVL